MKDFCQGFTLREKGGVSYLTIPAFESAGGVMCAFSTRIGGVSPVPYDTLNFSRKREQNENNFQENMRRFSNACGFDMQSAVAIHYAHSDKLHEAVKSDAGCGVTKENIPEICDGLFTLEEGLPLVSFHADCVPLFFYDPVRRAAAICHAGWKGTAAHIAANAVKSLTGMGCRAGDILAAVGPCISERCFEVGGDVADIFLKEFGEMTVRQRDSSFYVDLEIACAEDMTRCGITPGHITISRLCTFERDDLFFSHRRDKGKTGAMAAVIELT